MEAPPTLDSWKMEGSDLAVCNLEKFYLSESFIKLAVNIFPLNLKHSAIENTSKEEGKSETSNADSVLTTKSQLRRGKHCL